MNYVENKRAAGANMKLARRCKKYFAPTRVPPEGVTIRVTAFDEWLLDIGEVAIDATTIEKCHERARHKTRVNKGWANSNMPANERYWLKTVEKGRLYVLLPLTTASRVKRSEMPERGLKFALGRLTDLRRFEKGELEQLSPIDRLRAEMQNNTLEIWRRCQEANARMVLDIFDANNKLLTMATASGDGAAALALLPVPRLLDAAE